MEFERKKMSTHFYVFLLKLTLFSFGRYVNSVTEFQIGVAMLYNGGTPYDIERVGPAIDIALEKVNTYILNENYRIKKIEKRYGSVCDNSRASGVVADMFYKEHLDALIGPACPYALEPVARLASYWNIPVVTGLGDGGMFKNKTNYPTLTRMAYCQCRLRKVFGSVFEEFKWTSIAIIYDINDVHSEVLGTTLKVGLQKQNIFPFMFPYYGKENLDFKNILQEVRAVSRVILLIAPGDAVRRLLLKAYDLGYITSGEFVFFDVMLFPFPGDYWGDHDWYRGDERDQDARISYEAVIRISLQVPTSSEWQSFTNEVKNRSLSKYNFTFHDDEEVNFFIGAFHDSVILYGKALNETMEANNSVKNGLAFSKTMWNRTFEGVTGTVIIDDNGDRDTSYSILDMDPKTGKFHVIANFFGDRQWYNPVPAKSIHWAGGRTVAPLNRPTCGYLGDDPGCTVKGRLFAMGVIIASVLISTFIVVIAIFCVLRYIKKEKELLMMRWMIRFDDLHFQTNGFSIGSVITDASSLTKSRLTTNNLALEPWVDGLATYIGQPVIVKMIPKKKIEMTRTVLTELQQVKMMQHENLSRFVGACVEPNKICIVQEFCSKGSLEDLLENDNVKLDCAFKISLLKDIAKGMAFIQDSPIKFHGKLTSKCCMIDSRFVVKIADFGLNKFLEGAAIQENFYKRLWVAPEHLRVPSLGDAHGDVYSFAIIAVEIITRSTPFEAFTSVMSVDEIIEKLIAEENPPFRPILPKEREPSELVDIISRCWAEVPGDRPDFHSIGRSLRKIMGNKRDNFVDTLLQRMEKYASNLEDIVEQRTLELMTEKRRSDELLYQILPKSVADQLRIGKPVIPEQFKSVTIYFSDIVDFTAMSSDLTPMQVVDVLNDLYIHFDGIIDQFNVYKVETIGDAYMVVSGLPIRNGSQHASEICRLSLKLLSSLKIIQLQHVPSEWLKLRIGIHSGPCVAGVVGLKMPRYCLFGDTVNTASRMETNGIPLRIHISEATKSIVEQSGNFNVECRGNVTIKGKGIMETYWLIGEVDGSN